MREPVELSRKFLSDTGGWKEMKVARSLHAAGRVAEADYRDGVLEGLVREGSKTLKVRLEINSRIDMENRCPCFRARRDGIICAHALAVGLEFLEPTGKAETASEETSPEKAPPAKVPPSPDWPAFVEQATEDAVPADFHLVLPPDLPAAWDKGRITVGVEVEIDGERRMLKSLPRGLRLFLDAEDVSLYRALQDISPESVPGMAIVSTDDLSRLLAAIPGHPNVTLGKRTPLRISHLPFRPLLERLSGLRFRVRWQEDAIPLIAGRGTWALTDGNVARPVAPGLAREFQSVLAGGLTVDPADFLSALQAFRIHFEVDDLDIVEERAEVDLELEGSLNHLDARISFVYGGETFPANAERPPVREEKGKIHLADGATERAAVAELEAAGFGRRGAEGRFVLKDKSAILQFLAHGYPAFRDRWRTSTGERFEHALGQVEPIGTEMNFRSGGEDWFALEVNFGTPSGDTVSRQEIERLLRMGQSSKPLPNGRTAVLDSGLAESLGEIVSDCDPEQLPGGTYRIERSQAGYLRETIADCGFEAKGAVPWRTSEEGLDFYELPEDLGSVLRPYQKTGVEWMQGLASQGMGGILADDMGLGKTLQTLSFIYSVGGSSLVVCPSSLVHNWVAEAEKFVPGLKTVAIEGPDREKTLAEHGDADILVTSYVLLRRDEAWYRERDIDVVVLDEAQHIKNPDAQVSKAAHRLRGTHRFALTGTPIENSVRDLWSIAQFALPGYLGKRQEFAERFEKPLSASEPPAGVRERLSRRLRPVILRRLKREVAKDLPDKIEQVVYCDLTPTQQEVYAKLLRESKTSILEAEDGRQRMLALTALLRLRQTCCDLRLLGLPGIGEKEASVKAETLSELLDEALDGGHRVLVFSQFVEMLQLLVPQLAEKGIDFCYLDGRTKNRGEVVKRFQTGDVPVFLISLKAGGVGLNLTAADTVIHVDPWWNPAVETQATDRAHRIGQTNVVTSYKLITRGTVEEKILSLQDRKRKMTDALLSEAGDARLSEAELMSLFE
ncbi:MAG: SNF2-related protein [Verrucomicrobiales bacterium]